MKCARLQAAPTPLGYEFLRRLGSTLILEDLSDEHSDVTKNLDKLKRQLSSIPQTKNDSDTTRGLNKAIAGMEDSEILDQIMTLRGKHHGSETLRYDLEQESNLGFVVSHVRSDRYDPVEIAAIIRHLNKEFVMSSGSDEHPLSRLDELAETDRQPDAVRFISDCHDAYHRAEATFNKEEKHCWKLGVVLCWKGQGPGLEYEKTRLDSWWDRYRTKAEGVEESESDLTLEEQFDIIKEERDVWDQVAKDRHYRQGQHRPKATAKDMHPMFKYNHSCLFTMEFLNTDRKINDMQQSMKSYAERKRVLAECAERVTLKHCVKEVLDNFKDNGRDKQISDSRASKGMRMVAVFGYQDQVDEELAVVVRTVQLQADRRSGRIDDVGGDESVSLIEIGLNLKGSYAEYDPPKDDGESMISSSASSKFDRTEMKFFRYIKPGRHVPSSKSIEELFPASGSKFSHVQLCIPEELPSSTNNRFSEVSDAGGRFTIDLSNPGVVETEGLKYHPLPVKPEPSARKPHLDKPKSSAKPRGTESKVQNTISFQRLALMLPSSIPPLYYQLYQKLPQRAIVGGFSESAEIIAQVLELAYSAKYRNLSESNEDAELLRKQLEHSPLLLYYTTIELLNYFSEASQTNFSKTVADYWENKLKLKADTRSYLAREDKESRQLVFKLITSGTSAMGNEGHKPGPSSTNGVPSGSTTRSTGGQTPYCGALASDVHLKYLPDIIRNETKFNQQSFYVEETNFESTLQRLGTISTASITFIFVYITGRMSAHQVEKVISSAANTIKLIFRYSKSLENLLELTSVRDLMHRPQTLRSDVRAEGACVLYGSSPVGELVKFVTDQVQEDPTALARGDSKYWGSAIVEEHVDLRVDWEESIAKWLEFHSDSDPENFSSYVRTLVTTEPYATGKELGNSTRFMVHLFDAGNDADFHKLKELLDNEHPSTQAAKEGNKGLTSSETPSEGDSHPIIVLSRSYFLPHARLERLVSRCCVQKTKLLLLINKATSTMTRFRVSKDVRSPPTWIDVPAIGQRLRVSTHPPVFQGLQLIFSHDVVNCGHADSVETVISGGEEEKGEVTGSGLSFLGNDDSHQQRVWLRDLLEGLKSEKPFPALQEKVTTLASLLAAHVRVYLLYRKDGERSRAVSFKEFCWQPRVRFLGQIHRLEAYICYLYRNTASGERLHSHTRKETPLGIPLSESFVFHDNVHVGHTPEKLLSAVFDTASASAALKAGRIQPPKYLDPGSGDAMLHMQEIAEHRAVSGDELDWERVAVDWQKCYDIDANSLHHILKYSPSSISVLLSLSEHQIWTLTLSTDEYAVVKRDFMDSVDLLRSPSHGVDRFKKLRTRVASIYWLILSTGNAQNDDSIYALSHTFFEEDYNILIEEGFKPDLKVCPENMQLLSSFARAIIGLDRVEALRDQLAVCNFLFSNRLDCEEAVERVLDTAPIGAAFVWACVAHDRLGSIIAGKCGGAIFYRFGAVLKWIRDPNDSNAAEMGQALKRPDSTVASRLSAHAISAILQNVRTSKPTVAMQTACQHILSECLHRSQLPAAFLQEILTPFCAEKNMRGLAVALVFAIAKATRESTGSHGENRQSANEQDFETDNGSESPWSFPVPCNLHPTEPWETMFRAFRDESRASALFEEALQQRFVLPFNDSEALCQMYVSNLRTTSVVSASDVGPAIRRHKVLLPDEVSKGAIFKYLVTSSPQQASNAELVLLWFTWWFDPTNPLPQTRTPTKATWSLFEEVLREIRTDIEMLVGRLVRDNSGLSTWARFILTPYTLPASIINVLRSQIVDDSTGDHSGLLIQSKAYLLAQSGRKDWPAYSFRTHSRPLPQECIRKLVTLVQKSSAGQPFRSQVEGHRSYTLRFPKTHLGVSLEILKHNLAILVNLDQWYPRTTSSGQVFLTIRIWFQAAGFQLKDLREMCSDEEDKSQLMRLNNKGVKACQQQDFTASHVLEPLPIYVDVRLVSGKPVALFETRPESRATTKQWISMLLMQFGLDPLELNSKFEQYAQARCNNQPYRKSERYDIVNKMFFKIGQVLSNQHQDVQLSNADSTTQVVDELLPLVKFFSQMQISTAPEPYLKFAQAAFEGLSTGLQNSSANLQICMADGLFVLLGVTPLNGGIEIACMLACWREHDLVCGTSVINEVSWLRSNLYTPEIDKKIAERLDSVLARSPQKQEYSRPSASRPLFSRLDGDSNTSLVTYDSLYNFFGPAAQSLQADNVAGTLQAEYDLGQSNHQITAGYSLVQRSQVPSFDHVPHHVDAQALVRDSVDDFSLFKPRSMKKAGDQERRMTGSAGSIPAEMNTAPQTISARELVHLHAHPRFAVLRVEPGLHPILRSPGDECNTPVLQCKKEKSPEKKSQEKSLDSAHAESCRTIEHIFSHNGDTWFHLDKLPPESTIVCQGFYLRKTEHQGWVLLLGTSDEKAVKFPKYSVWNLFKLDTMCLGSVDLHSDVVEILKSIVLLAFEQKPDPQTMVDEKFGGVLSEIRKWSFGGADVSTKYDEYLRREEVVCQHFKEVLGDISRCKRSKPLRTLLKIQDLEQSLGDTPKQKGKLCEMLCIKLCTISERRNEVPRSQLVFSLDLSLVNLQARGAPKEQQQPAVQNGGNVSGESTVWSEEIDVFALDDAVESSSGGIALQRHNSNLMMSMDSGAVQDKQIAAHEHITKSKFRERSVGYIKQLEEAPDLSHDNPQWTRDFSDSDDDEGEDGRRSSVDGEDETARLDADDSFLDKNFKKTDIKECRVEQTEYIDDYYDTTLTDASGKKNTLLPDKWGYGLPACSNVRVLSLLGENVPLYFQDLECRRLKIKYSNADGLPIAVVFHKTLLHRVLSEQKEALESASPTSGSNTLTSSTRGVGDNISKLLHFRDQVLRWLKDLVRSPLPDAAIYWFMDKLEHGATTLAVPFMGGQGQKEDINLKAIAHCLATALPKSIPSREVFLGFEIEKGFLPFCTRKNDMYGIHIVRGGTLTRLQEWGVNVELCELGYDAMTQAKDKASMYLNIISKFSKYTWIVYVTGLDTIDDALLKWLAEYTKLHPWRFVFLENTQTSWNFSENRDRCSYFAAPPTVESKIEKVEDLKSEGVALLRPHHEQVYDRLAACIESSRMNPRNANWEELSCFSTAFFSSTEHVQELQLELPEAQKAWQTIKPEAMKKGEQDLSTSVGQIFTSKPDAPCVVLLCSPPGTGKSHFSEELARAVKTQSATIDGSDDRLVDMALREILDLELPDATRRLFLIVDEFHMLNENHKVDLFVWLQERARTLQVLLIANRKDARDDELLENFSKGSGIPPDRVQNIATRLSLNTLGKVMDEQDVRHKDEIRRWVHCARCLFGGEAVSLRNIGELDRAMSDPRGREGALEKLLLQKIPIISKATARDFVACFNLSLPLSESDVGNVASGCKSPVSLMFQAALCTEQDDAGMDYPDFVSFGLKRAYDGPPSLRITAWCCHMRAVSKFPARVALMDAPRSIFVPSFVDQCGFPLQLHDEHRRDLSSGFAFSWSGDYSELREITNAVSGTNLLGFTQVN